MASTLGQTGHSRNVVDHVMDLPIHLRQGLMDVLNMLVGHLHQSATAPHQDRTAHTSPSGRNAARSNHTECRNCIHWHSCQSVRRPGTFFIPWASTKQGFSPCCSSTS
jgi:hypothetical protein